MSEKLPLDILKEKYIPVEQVPERYNISVAQVMELIKNKKLRYAEFKVPGAIRRTPHINPEDLFAALGRKGEI